MSHVPSITFSELKDSQNSAAVLLPCQFNVLNDSRSQSPPPRYRGLLRRHTDVYTCKSEKHECKMTIHWRFILLRRREMNNFTQPAFIKETLIKLINGWVDFFE